MPKLPPTEAVRRPPVIYRGVAVAEASHAVFLSYASQDAAAAARICEALRSAGIEVWFDQSELRGGDAWDRRIREQIHDCRLFIPVISTNSERRDEGYFRREWSLAVDRTRDMAHKRAFLLPVVIDGTPERGASVPEKFYELQWTRLPDGETTPAFVEHVRRLLSPEVPSARAATPASPVPTTVQPSQKSVASPWRSKAGLWVPGVVVAAALAYVAADKFVVSRHSLPPTPPAAPPAAGAPATAAAFNPPSHSIAVLPFVNMSGDKEQEYFSDGLTEEILNSLSRINELQVAGRTSSFYFKGKDVDLATVAHKLNVGAVLEGSVRRSAHTVRITAQLVNTSTEFHLWSQTYDRELGDVLSLQAEIATAVASALKATLLGDEAARIELGGTRNPAAFDAYLRATKAHFAVHSQSKEELKGIAAYSEAISLDPKYALAYVGRSIAYTDYVRDFGGPNSPDAVDKAQSDARRAIALAPELGEAHMALAYFLDAPGLDFAQASHEYERALALAPGKARVLWNYGNFAATMGRFDAGIAAGRRAVLLDPLNTRSHTNLGATLLFARRYDEAIAAFQEAITLDPDYAWPYADRGIAYYLLGKPQSAASSCETKPDFGLSQLCLAITYYKLGRHADAESSLAKLRASTGDAAAVGYAETYAQWGDTKQALHWLDSALRLHDPDLATLKVDPLLDPLRDEPRFQAI